MNYIEFIGIGATLLILVSMCFKTVSFKGSLLLRSLNIAGSVVFVVYGALLPAISTAVLNGCLVIVNTVHLILLIKEQKKNKTKFLMLKQQKRQQLMKLKIKNITSKNV